MMNDDNDFQGQNLPSKLTNDLAQIEAGSLIGSVKTELDGHPVRINVLAPTTENIQQALTPELLHLRDALRKTGLGPTEFVLNVSTCVSAIDVDGTSIIDVDAKRIEG